MLIKAQDLESIYQTSGIIGVSLILFYCLVQVFDTRVKEGALGCVVYLVIATSCVAWLFHMFMGTFPHRTTTTLICGIAVLMMRRLILLSPLWTRFKSWWFMRVKIAKAANATRRTK